MPLQFRALPDYRCPIPASTTVTETMPKLRFLSAIGLFHHPRFWPKNSVFSPSDSMHVVSDSRFCEETCVRNPLFSGGPIFP